MDGGSKDVSKALRGGPSVPLNGTGNASPIIPGDARSLYEKFEQVVLPLFYGDRSGFIDVMRHAIALNGSFFNTHRMLQQYVVKAYF